MGQSSRMASDGGKTVDCEDVFDAMCSVTSVAHDPTFAIVRGVACRNARSST